MTGFGGTSGKGAIYRLTQVPGAPGTWTEEVLHSFDGQDGSLPFGSLLLGPAGELYGTTSNGGDAGLGTVFRLDQTPDGWTITTLHSFQGQGDGELPAGAVAFGPSGLLYGVTPAGGAYGGGVVYSVSTTGTSAAYAIVHNFNAPGKMDGYFPYDALYPIGNGFIGTTVDGPGGGTVFTLSLRPTGDWAEKIIHNFGGPNDFNSPLGVLIQGRGGEFYGCAVGGAFGQGGIFALQHSVAATAAWTERAIYNFGSRPNDPSLIDSYGNCGVTLNLSGEILGTTGIGGTLNAGTFFQLTPPATGQKWTETILHNFSSESPLGSNPTGAPLRVGGLYYGGNYQTVAGSSPLSGNVYTLNPAANGQ